MATMGVETGGSTDWLGLRQRAIDRYGISYGVVLSGFQEMWSVWDPSAFMISELKHN